MIAEDLLFWLAPIQAAPERAGVLCRRHADSMVVPRGWTLDDRRNGGPRLFQAERFVTSAEPAPKAVRARSRPAERPEQLQIDGTGEIPRPPDPEPQPDAAPEPAGSPWRPEFDTDDDLDGLLKVTSPLLSRAFRGTDLPPR